MDAWAKTVFHSVCSGRVARGGAHDIDSSVPLFILVVHATLPLASVFDSTIAPRLLF